jgi:ketosteroid isomerase-like protein
MPAARSREAYMPTTEQTVATLYDSWRKGDLDAVMGMLADDVEWTIHIPPSINPVGGTVRGRAAVAERFHEIVRDYEIRDFGNGDILTNGEEAAARVRMHYLHRPSEQVLETIAMHHWKLDDGRVVLIEEFHDVDTMRAFGKRCGFCE